MYRAYAQLQAVCQCKECNNYVTVELCGNSTEQVSRAKRRVLLCSCAAEAVSLFSTKPVLQTDIGTSMRISGPVVLSQVVSLHRVVGKIALRYCLETMHSAWLNKSIMSHPERLWQMQMVGLEATRARPHL